MSGSTVQITTSLIATPSITAELAGICVRSASGADLDLPFSTNVRLSSRAVTLTKQQTFSPGTYTYWACVQDDRRWYDLGAKQTFTVRGATAAPPSGGSSSSGEAMPTGNIGSWRQVLAEDFNTPLARGQFPGPYSTKWRSYDGFANSNGLSWYNQDIISMHDGVMDLWLHQENGMRQSAAPTPFHSQPWVGMKYGKYTVRFKADRLPGYKMAFLLWPDSDNWNQGEIDWPEGGLGSSFMGFNHCINNPSNNCYWVDPNTTSSIWHTASLEWKPGSISYLLDGRVIGTTTNNIPSVPMHLMLQVEADPDGVSSSNLNQSGSLLVDWVTLYTWAG
ncbi:glycoside hydrolase family 16 protein [Nakamurella leprariae]|uniref:Glycoside hydrolase family 16 protein n=1 Tax=Nakamurella leprariae TaxID=2803911 RepID=A0A938Y8P1_9ACTN|nr:glycoside hydrolase family 16 protein [Nakamurella leprariae]MBM9467880.1 glycoside hydrolase family 16 protein [Nakamurella leprariae]